MISILRAVLTLWDRVERYQAAQGYLVSTGPDGCYVVYHSLPIDKPDQIDNGRTEEPPVCSSTASEHASSKDSQSSPTLYVPPLHAVIDRFYDELGK